MTDPKAQPVFICLCCDQPVTTPRQCPDPAKAWEILQGMGYTREELLTTYLENIDFTARGFSDWLRYWD